MQPSPSVDVDIIDSLLPLLILKGRLGFPGGSVVKNQPAKAGDMGQSLGREDPPRRWKWQPTPIFLPGTSRAWWATVHGVSKESDMTALAKIRMPEVR